LKTPTGKAKPRVHGGQPDPGPRRPEGEASRSLFGCVPAMLWCSPSTLKISSLSRLLDRPPMPPRRQADEEESNRGGSYDPTMLCHGARPNNPRRVLAEAKPKASRLHAVVNARVNLANRTSPSYSIYLDLSWLILPDVQHSLRRKSDTFTTSPVSEQDRRYVRENPGARALHRE
jgi:hypothetical protein